MQQFGRTSLFIYWIHIEMVYGVLSAPLHKRLPLGTAIVGLVVFAVFLFGLSLLKNWAVRLWRGRHESPGGRASVAIR